MSTHQLANWIGTDPHGCLRGATAKWAKWIGTTGIVGLVSCKVGGVYLAQWAMQSDKSLPPYISNISPRFLPCGTNVSLFFRKRHGNMRSVGLNHVN